MDRLEMYNEVKKMFADISISPNTFYTIRENKMKDIIAGNEPDIYILYKNESEKMKTYEKWAKKIGLSSVVIATLYSIKRDDLYTQYINGLYADSNYADEQIINIYENILKNEKDDKILEQVKEKRLKTMFATEKHGNFLEELALNRFKEIMRSERELQVKKLKQMINLIKQNA